MKDIQVEKKKRFSMSISCREMSWLSDITDRAESLLTQLDQGAADVLRKVSSQDRHN